MIRQASRVALLAAAAALAAGAAARQTGAALDKVTIRNAAKKDGSTVTVEGKLKLTPAGLQILTGEKLETARTIRYSDVVKFEPGDLPGVNRDEMLSQIKLEAGGTKKDYETARGVYAAMLKKAAGGGEPTRRFLEFKVAMMSTRVADESGDDERWAELADVAVKEWNGFLTGYTTGWEVWPAARALARLYVELNKYDEAARLWGRMAKNPELPPDLKLEAAVQEVDAQFRAKAFATAASLAESLGKSAGPGTEKDKLALYERAARAAEKAAMKPDALRAAAEDLKKTAGASKDPAVRGAGFGLAGELYLLAGRPREAMWEFLAVETLYNSEKDEVLKAMCRVVDSFKAQADEDRAKQYRDKIRRFRENL